MVATTNQQITLVQTTTTPQSALTMKQQLLLIIIVEQVLLLALCLLALPLLLAWCPMAWIHVWCQPMVVFNRLGLVSQLGHIGKMKTATEEEMLRSYQISIWKSLVLPSCVKILMSGKLCLLVAHLALSWSTPNWLQVEQLIWQWNKTQSYTFPTMVRSDKAEHLLLNVSGTQKLKWLLTVTHK